ncbi:MAG: TraX family protein, partial [Halobacteriota archaeon]
MADRIHSIDAMRIVAMVFVVLIHTDPFQGLSAAGTAITFGIKTTGRFAVPFFFVASGYFFASKTAGGDPTGYVRARARAILSLYVFGLVLAAPTFLAGRLVRAALDGR